MSTFGYCCESCGDRVVLSLHEFNRRQGIVRCPTCLEKLARVTTARKLRTIQKTRIPAPRCDSCGTTSHPRRHSKLDPKNLHEHVRLLCPPCGRKLRYQPVTYDRTSANVHGRSAA